MNNKVEKQKNYKTNLNVIYAVLFCILASIFIIIKVDQNERNYIENYSKDQQILVDEVARRAEERLLNGDNKDTELIENDVINNILKKSETSGSKYWIFGKDHKFIFKKDDEISSDTKGKNIKDVLKDDEIVSIKYFKINETDYFIGMCTNKSYALSSAKINKLNIYIFIFTGVFCFMLLILVISYYLKIKSYETKIEKQEKEIRGKNLLIQTLTSNERLSFSVKEKDLELNKNVVDNLTKTYNREFLKKLLEKISCKRGLLVTAIIFSIYDFDRLTHKKFKNEVLVDTTNIINNEKSKNYILSRINNAQFALIMINSNKSDAKNMANKVSLKFNERFKKLNLILLYGISEKNTDTDNIYEVMSEAVDNIKNTKNI